MTLIAMEAFRIVQVQDLVDVIRAVAVRKFGGDVAATQLPSPLHA